MVGFVDLFVEMVDGVCEEVVGVVGGVEYGFV